MKFDKYLVRDKYACLRPTDTRSLTTADLLRDMTEACSMTPSDGKGVLSFISIWLGEKLATGSTITIDDIGTFGLALQLDGDINAEKINGRQVRLKRVTFRAAPTMREIIEQNIQAHRIDPKLRHEAVDHYQPEQRRDMVAEYLRENDEITIPQYRMLVHVANATAVRDLRRFTDEGLLSCRKLGRNSLFRLKQE